MTAVAVVAHRVKVDRSTRQRLQRALDGAGMADAPWLMVEKGRKAEGAARRALDEGATTVIVCGGDGTVRAAAQGLVGSGAALAVVPCGTANLFATAMGLPSAPSDVVEAVLDGTRRTIDTGTCNDLTFNVMGGTGLDAAMIDAADDHKERLGMLAYVRAIVQQTREREPVEMEVRVDGAPFFAGAATCVLVGNLGTLKGGVEAFPEASPTDGLLDVAVVTASGMREWAHVLASVVRRRQHLSGLAHMGQGAAFDVLLDGKHRFELDGGTRGRAKRLAFAVAPASLVVCTATDR